MFSVQFSEVCASSQKVISCQYSNDCHLTTLIINSLNNPKIIQYKQISLQILYNNDKICTSEKIWGAPNLARIHDIHSTSQLFLTQISPCCSSRLQSATPNRGVNSQISNVAERSLHYTFAYRMTRALPSQAQTVQLVPLSHSILVTARCEIRQFHKSKAQMNTIIPQWTSVLHGSLLEFRYDELMLWILF